MSPNRKIDPSNMAVTELKRYKLRIHILKTLYKKGMQSSSSLTKKTNVSLPTVRSVLNDLIKEKIVSASGIGDSIGGRKPVIYSLEKDAYFVLAVEMGHYTAKATIVDCLNNHRAGVQEFETNIDDPELEMKLEKVLDILLQEAGLSKDKLSAVGVAMPGLIDSDHGINKTIKDPEAQNIGERLSTHFRIRTFIENDARMQALGEFVLGKAKNAMNTLVVNWSWGLGLGVILNGEIYKGANGCAGEFSHIRITENGNLCECGKRGCLQTIAGARHLLNMAREEVQKGTISQLTKLFGAKPQEMNPADIINCAKKGDELSISLLNVLSTNVAWGLSILIQIYNPEQIVLNGPMAKGGQYILIPIQQAINQYCLTNISEHVRIEISDLGEHSGLQGVSVMVFHKLFRDKSLEQAGTGNLSSTYFKNDIL
ncbi:MAG: ROK family transcriptional regulator [Prolixibacteraceae bacterium]